MFNVVPKGLWGAVCANNQFIFAEKSKRVPAGTLTLLCLLFPYFRALPKTANVALFAALQDYHRVIKQLMLPDIENLYSQHPNHFFEVFVDNSPFYEVRVAAAAGLGIIGKNNLLQHPIYGSYVFIAVVATSLPYNISVHKIKYCRGCGACIAACPGGAITDDGFYKTRCASYISQQKGELSLWQQEILKKSKSCFGCDICQRVCPANIAVKDGIFALCDDINPHYRVKDLSVQIKGRAPEWRGEAVLLRNIAILE